MKLILDLDFFDFWFSCEQEPRCISQKCFFSNDASLRIKMCSKFVYIISKKCVTEVAEKKKMKKRRCVVRVICLSLESAPLRTVSKQDLEAEQVTAAFAKMHKELALPTVSVSVQNSKRPCIDNFINVFLWPILWSPRELRILAHCKSCRHFSSCLNNVISLKFCCLLSILSLKQVLGFFATK